MAPHPRLSVNIAKLFTERDLSQRLMAAEGMGFKGVELPDPYDHPAPDLRDKGVFAGIGFNRIAGPPPNYTGGAPGYAAVPSLTERFRKDLKRCLRQAQVLGAELIQIECGPDAHTDRTTLIENMTWAAKEASEHVLLIEALNPKSHGGHCLETLESTMGIIEDIGARNVRMMFSTFHVLEAGRALSAAWELCHDSVGHIALGGGAADETSHGASEMLSLTKASGYRGWLCADYHPLGPTERSLGWMPR